MDKQEILDSILDEEAYPGSKELVRDYISKESIKAIETFMDFFKDIPDTEVREVFEHLLSLIYNYEFNIWYVYAPINVYARQGTKRQKQRPNKEIKLSELLLQGKREARPTTKINQDLELLKKYKNMLDRLFNKSKDENKFFTLGVDKDVITLYETNNRLIEDLEKKGFKIISKESYYEPEPTSKKDIKDFLNRVAVTYSLKNVSHDKKNLIDNIPSNVDGLYTNDV